MRLSKPVLTGIVLAIILGGVTIVRLLSSQPAVLDRGVKMPSKVIGAPGAKVRIVEFTDLQCPACARASMILHEAIERYPGKITVALKHFPLPMHKNAHAAAVAAQCAAEQGKFWPMERVLFMSQKSWGELRDPADYFLSLARGLGLDDRKLATCMTSSAAEQGVADDLAEGQSMGVKATPTFFVNGKMAVGATNLEAALLEALK